MYLLDPGNWTLDPVVRTPDPGNRTLHFAVWTLFYLLHAGLGYTTFAFETSFGQIGSTIPLVV